MSAAVARVRPCSCWKGGPAGATPSAQQARTMHTPESQIGRARHAAAATARADSLWCHFVWTPEPPQQHLIVQLLLRVDRVWKLSFSTSDCVRSDKRRHKKKINKAQCSIWKETQWTLKHYWCCPINVNSCISDFYFLLLLLHFCAADGAPLDRSNTFLLCRIISNNNKKEVHSFKI